MADVHGLPKWRDALKKLVVPEFWAMSRWYYQNGSCYVTIAAAGGEQSEVFGWGCLTFEDEPWPVVGVFVREDCRGRGIACDLVESLFRIHRGAINTRGGKVYAATQRFPYERVCAKHGFECIPWE